MRLYAVCAHADEAGSQLDDCLILLFQGGDHLPSAGRHVLNVEGDDELSARRVCSEIQIARSAGQGKVWGKLSHLWHVTLRVELG